MSANHQPTVRQIAAGSLSAVRVFEQAGIDYCCGGNRPLEEACGEKGIAIEEIRERLARAAVETRPEDRNWSQVPLRELIEHIVGRHHAYLNAELPRLEERLSKVVRNYSDRDGEMLAKVARVFGALKDELEGHLMKEERILFPAVAMYEDASAKGRPLPPVPFGTVRNPIGMMEYEHENAGSALAELRSATDGYAVPEYACPTYRALLEGLAELEGDLHRHIHLENNILFPRAAELEARLAG